MTRKLRVLIPAVALMLCSLMPVSASVWTDADTFKDLYIEDNEISTGGSVSMIMGSEKDLSGFIRHGAWDETSYDQWYLVGRISWESSNPDIVSVNGQGVASAHKAGVARITAACWDNLDRKHIQSIIVGVSREGSTILSNSFEISQGTWLDLRQLGELHSGSQEIQWVSSVSDIASVDSAGLVRAGNVGRCVITAAYLDENGTEQEIKYQIRVTSTFLSSQIRSGTIILRAGDEIDVGAMYYPNSQKSLGTLSDIYCTTVNQNIVAIGNLSIYAKDVGSSSVSIKKNDKSEEITLFKLTVVVEQGT